jgi:hypothetical protein
MIYRPCATFVVLFYLPAGRIFRARRLNVTPRPPEEIEHDERYADRNDVGDGPRLGPDHNFSDSRYCGLHQISSLLTTKPRTQMREKATERPVEGVKRGALDELRRTAPLAMTSANCYGDPMLPEKTRRISALLSALVLAVGLVAHGFAGPDIVVQSAVTAAIDVPMSGDMPMPGKCDGCAGDEKGVALAACSAFCGAVIAAPSVMAIFVAVPIETLAPSAGAIFTGHTDPPDPYPPRPTILS